MNLATGCNCALRTKPWSAHPVGHLHRRHRDLLAHHRDSGDGRLRRRHRGLRSLYARIVGAVWVVSAATVRVASDSRA